MKIEKIQIKRFRSLQDVKLENMGDLSVFIGANSSGKSNFLEALNMFFSDFSLTGGTTSGLDEYSWYKRRTKEPIEFSL